MGWRSQGPEANKKPLCAAFFTFWHLLHFLVEATQLTCKRVHLPGARPACPASKSMSRSSIPILLPLNTTKYQSPSSPGTLSSNDTTKHKCA